MTEEKLFKHGDLISFSGNQKQLAAFEAELLKAGYKPDNDPDFNKWREGFSFILTYYTGDYIYCDHPGIGRDIHFSSKQFELAVKVATEPA